MASTADLLCKQTEQEVQVYLAQHKIQEKVEDAINAAVAAKAPDPFVFMSDMLVPAHKRQRSQDAESRAGPEVKVEGGIGTALPSAPEHPEAIYLDYQATTPVWPEVADAAVPYLRLHWGNPSSTHAFGPPCAAAVARARESVARLIGAAADEVLFVSCGSEADNHAILGALARIAAARPGGGGGGGSLPHIVTSNIEHPAVTACVEHLVRTGHSIS